MEDDLIIVRGTKLDALSIAPATIEDLLDAQAGELRDLVGIYRFEMDREGGYYSKLDPEDIDELVEEWEGGEEGDEE